MNRRDFLKKTAIVPAVVAVPVLAKVPDRMPVPAAPEVVDAAWEQLLQDTPMTATEVLAAREEMCLRAADRIVNPPIFGNGTIRFPTIIKRTLT